MYRLCSKAEYCSRDIFRKALKDLEGDAEAASAVLASLVEDRYVDDVRYASAFAREKSSLQGWGALKIRFQLRAKGLSEEAISAGLAEIDGQRAGERLERLIRETVRLLRGDPQCRLKLIRFALGRGYEYGDVSAAVESVMKEDL